MRLQSAPDHRLRDCGEWLRMCCTVVAHRLGQRAFREQTLNAAHNLASAFASALRASSTKCASSGSASRKDLPVPPRHPSELQVHEGASPRAPGHNATSKPSGPAVSALRPWRPWTPCCGRQPPRLPCYRSL